MSVPSMSSHSREVLLPVPKGMKNSRTDGSVETFSTYNLSLACLKGICKRVKLREQLRPYQIGADNSVAVFKFCRDGKAHVSDACMIGACSCRASAKKNFPRGTTAVVVFIWSDSSLRAFGAAL